MKTVITTITQKDSGTPQKYPIGVYAENVAMSIVDIDTGEVIDSNLQDLFNNNKISGTLRWTDVLS